MKKIWIFLFCTSITACVVNHTYQQKLPSSDKQCEILAEKRNSFKSREKSKRFKIKEQQESTTSTTKGDHITIPSLEIASLTPAPLEPELLLNSVLAVPDKKVNKKEQNEKVEIYHPTATGHFEVSPVIKSTSELSKATLPLPAQSTITSDSPLESYFIKASPWILGFSGILTLVFMSLFKRQFQNISAWGSKNPVTTRFLITAIHLALAFGSVSFGNHLAEEGLFFSKSFTNTALAIVGTSALLYPMRNTRFNILKNSFYSRKALDLVLFTSGAALLLSFSNTYQPSPNSYLSFIPESQVVASSSSTVSATANYSLATKEYAFSNKPQKEQKIIIKILLTFLAAMAFVALGFVVAGLACGLACNGMGGLAILVGIVGGGGLIFLLVLALKSIYGKSNKKEGVPEENDLNTQPLM